MKANEAPEKIYISLDEIDDLALVHRFDYPICIEYTRTDVFIEKAISWLKEQDEIILVSFQEDFLERFRNYMKGE